jgi:FAD/FMN-containing dehydrogenase
LKEGIAAVEKLAPGVRPVPFGHLGDGNIHFNFTVPKNGDNAAFLARWNEIQDTVHDIVKRYHGSISAEHGLGIMKVHEIERYKSAAELDVMRALKRTLDPNNILNPGKVVAI